MYGLAFKEAGKIFQFFGIIIFIGLLSFILFTLIEEFPYQATALSDSVNNVTTEITNLNNTVKAGNRTHAFNEPGNITKLNPGTLAGTSAEHPSLVDMVVKELTNSNPAQIASLPLDDLSSNDLVKVFSSLSAQVLYKTLKNINTETLRNIFLKKLSPEQVNNIVEKLPSDKREEIQNRVMSSSS
jgi:hypothetical protein